MNRIKIKYDVPTYNCEPNKDYALNVYEIIADVFPTRFSAKIVSIKQISGRRLSDPLADFVDDYAAYNKLTIDRARREISSMLYWKWYKVNHLGKA